MSNGLDSDKFVASRQAILDLLRQLFPKGSAKWKNEELMKVWIDSTVEEIGKIWSDEK